MKQLKQPQTSRQYIEVRMSPAQVQAVLRVLGNSTCHPDAMDALFPHHASRAACHRGEDALVDALIEWERTFVGKKP